MASLDGFLTVLRNFRRGDMTAIRSIVDLSDTEIEQLKKWQLWEAYYLNNAYDWLNVSTNDKKGQNIAEIQARKQLYAAIRGFYAPCGEAVDIDKQMVWSKSTVVDSRSLATETRIQSLWRRSLWQQKKGRLVQYGSSMGQSYIRIIDDWSAGVAKMVIHSPQEMQVFKDPHDETQILMARLTYMYEGFTDQGSRTKYRYTALMFPDMYVTFRDNEEYAYPDNPQDPSNPGSTVSRWRNALGFVPVFEIQHTDIGAYYGLPTFSKQLPTLDAVNELVSFASQIYKVHGDPVLVAMGIKPGSLEKKTTTDGTTVWHIPLPPSGMAQPKLDLLTVTSSIPDVVGLLDKLSGHISDTLPELHMDQIRRQVQASGFAVSLQASQLTAKLQGLRDAYFFSTKLATATALAIEDQIRAGTIVETTVNGLDFALAAEQKYQHEIIADPFLPKDVAGEANLVYADLSNELIDPAEAMRRRGYSDREIFGVDDQGNAQVPTTFETRGMLSRVRSEHNKKRKEATEDQAAATQPSRVQPSGGNNQPTVPNG